MEDAQRRDSAAGQKVRACRQALARCLGASVTITDLGSSSGLGAPGTGVGGRAEPPGALSTPERAPAACAPCVPVLHL